MGLMRIEESYTGTYRGTIVDHGVAITTNGYPQWVVALKATQYYDEEAKAWVDWSDRDDVEITAYLVLAGKEQKEIFHCKNIEKAVGWNGASWSSLATMDLSEVGVQFRVEEHTYNENTSLQVAGIDHWDAEPGRRVQKLDASELKALDAKFASFFRGRVGEKKPVKPTGKPVVPAKTVKPKVTASTPKAEEPEQPETEAPPTAKKPKATKKTEKVERCTQAEAWLACKKAKDKSISDKDFSQKWLDEVAIIAPDGDEDNMNDEAWARLRDIVIEKTTADGDLKF